jgi:hypothetical protein
MRHHEPLIAMRRHGAKPAKVRLEVGHVSPEAEHWPRWRPHEAHIAFSLTDDPRLLDLRFLVGCDVTIDGFWPDDEVRLETRMRQLFEASIRARVSSVSVLHLFPEDEVLLWRK